MLNFSEALTGKLPRSVFALAADLYSLTLNFSRSNISFPIHLLFLKSVVLRPLTFPNLTSFSELQLISDAILYVAGDFTVKAQTSLGWKFSSSMYTTFSRKKMPTIHDIGCIAKTDQFNG